MSFHPTIWPVAAVAAALLLAACGGSSGTDDAGTDDAGSAAHGGGHTASESMADPVDGAAELTVKAVDIDFEPAQVAVTAGEPVNVTVTNEGEAFHDFTLDAADVHVNVEAGESKTTSFTIDEPGTYQAKCTVAGHAEAGMTLDVVVDAS